MIGDVTVKKQTVNGQFTPGPWKVIPPGHGHETEYLCVQVGEDESYTTLEMQPADARLVAASPELLACLETFARMDGQDRPISGGQWNAAVVMARAAIAKARGEPS